MSKSGTQSKTGSKVSKKAEKTPKKVSGKTVKKPRGKPFEQGNEISKLGGRPKGSKDFATVFNEVTKNKGKEQAVKEMWNMFTNKNTSDQVKVQIGKLLFEYLFEKPSQTFINENRNLDLTDSMTDEEIRAEIDRLEKAI